MLCDSLIHLLDYSFVKYLRVYEVQQTKKARSKAVQASRPKTEWSVEARDGRAGPTEDRLNISLQSS